MISLHETCQQYVARRLSEGWRIISQKGFNVVLLSPEGIIRPVDLRNDVETLRPNAAGDECNIPQETGAACPNHYQNVDEEVADGSTTMVLSQFDAIKYRDLYNLPASSGSGDINSITVYARCWAASDSGYGINNGYWLAIKSGATTAESAEKNLAAVNTWETISETWATNPDTGNPWTWNEIDDLQIGVALQGTRSGPSSWADAACTQVYVEVNYTGVAVGKSSWEFRKSHRRLGRTAFYPDLTMR